MNVERRQVAADPQTKRADLGAESACRLLESTPTIVIYYYYRAKKLTFIFTVPRRVKGRVDLGGWPHTEMIYPPSYGFPSLYWPGPTYSNKLTVFIIYL